MVTTVIEREPGQDDEAPAPSPDAPVWPAPAPRNGKGHDAAKKRPSLTLDARTFVGDDEPEGEDLFSPLDWVVPRFVPRAALTVVGGMPKVGKTWFVLDLAIAVTTGQPLCGFWPVHKGRVIAILEEDTRRRIQRRLWRLARGRDMDPRALDGLRLAAMSGFRLDLDDMRSRLEAEIKEHGADLLIIDALARVHGADENDRTAMRAVTVPLQDLCAKYSVAVVLIHHFRKLGKDDDNRSPGELLRGSVDLWALSRSVVGLRRQSDVAGIVVDASGNDEEVEACSVVIESGENSCGKPTVRLVYRGPVADADLAAEAPRILALIQAAMPGGITGDALRKEAGGKGTRIDAVRDYLAARGQIHYGTATRRWRVQGPA